jgi:pimeloyl-ACP methyl ester carboxylesterase
LIPIVLVPGLLCTAEVFACQIAALWPFGPITVASTLQGETMPEIASTILADAPPRFALAGISMGGYVCLEIIKQAPERVLKLALLDSSARADTPDQIARRRALLAQAKLGGFPALAAQLLNGIMHPTHRNDPTLHAVNERMSATIGSEGFARQIEAIIARGDSRSGLVSISVPTLILVGDSDPLTPPDRSEEMAAAIPGARLVVVPECGHASTLEQPQAVNRALVEWISG